MRKSTPSISTAEVEERFLLQALRRLRTTEQRYIVRQGAITLDPDVREYFPDSEKVNAALRAIIAIMPGKPPSHPRRQGARKTPAPTVPRA